MKIESGKRFGRWTVGSIGPIRRENRYWTCRCDCGVESLVSSSSLLGGKSTSCGCRKREVATIHGCSETIEYHIWEGMLSRCYNPNSKNYKSYGGRGIIVCDRWKTSFVNFLSDMGHRASDNLSLGRQDNDGNYEPGNCAWETGEEQGNNKRNSRKLTVKGETKTVAQWSRATGIGRTTIHYRIRNGYTAEAALI